MTTGFSNSRDIDAITRDNNLELNDFRATIPPELMQPNELRSWLTVLRVMVCVLVCQYLLFLIQPTADQTLILTAPALCLMWCLYGAVLLGFFLIGHDCGHGSFSKHRKINIIVGTICTAPIFNGFRTWTLTHNHHHQFTQIRGEDVDWSSHLVTEAEYKDLNWKNDWVIKLGYAIPFGIFFWIMWNAIQRGGHVKPMLTEKVYKRHKTALRNSNIVMVVVTSSIYLLFWYFTGFWGMIKYHGMPVLLASLLAGVMVSVGHANQNTIWYERKSWTPVRGQLVSTYDYRFPKWLEFLVLNINIHIPHHISVRIPWYNLKSAAKVLQDNFPEYYQELPFHWADMNWIVWAPFLKKFNKHGFYQLDTPGR
jgi:acyl-lipid omega-6 desaturase (Delta-12 desaturase)